MVIYGAYGSNLNMAQMSWRCPDAKPIGTAVLEGYRLCFKGSKTGSYLTVEKAEGHSVPLGLWKISKADEKSLDRYEGYPKFYGKEYIPVIVNGRKHNVLVYVMNEDRRYGMPSAQYLAACMVGYDDFGMDSELLKQAVRYTAKKAKGEVRGITF